MRFSLNLFNNTLFFDSPWLQENKLHEERYKELLAALPKIQPQNRVFHQIEFPKPFNYRTKYYRELFTNDIFGYLNDLGERVQEAESESLKLYEVDAALSGLKSLLEECHEIIQEKDFNFQYLEGKYPITCTLEHKNDTYILLFFETITIFSILELQVSYNQYVKSEVLTYKEIYLSFLNDRLPDSSISISIISNDATLKTPVKQVQGNIYEMKKVAEKYLAYLHGNNLQKTKIMQNNDYERLLEYTFHLIENETLPENIKKISQLNIPSGYIRYTYYLIHKELYTTKAIKTQWIDFLQQVFVEFKDTDWQTIKTKFSTKPNLYETDILKMQG
ncbi:MAG: hypothetical protein K2Q22_06170 [Cytophagales bacterium]|nr:hypothetical protein [Cytophagales bacterium]